MKQIRDRNELSSDIQTQNYNIIYTYTLRPNSTRIPDYLFHRFQWGVVRNLLSHHKIWFSNRPAKKNLVY